MYILSLINYIYTENMGPTKSYARHKTNANYGNLMSDELEKRVAKNLFYDSCLTLELGEKIFYIFLYSNK